MQELIAKKQEKNEISMMEVNVNYFNNLLILISPLAFMMFFF